MSHIITCGISGGSGAISRSFIMKPKKTIKLQYKYKTDKITLNSIIITKSKLTQHTEIFRSLKFPFHYKFQNKIRLDKFNHGLTINNHNNICYASSSSSSEVHNEDYYNKRKKENFLISFFKRIITWVAFALLAASLTVVALPMFMSTTFGLSATMMAANVFVPGMVEVGNADLGWNKPIRIQDICIKEGLKKRKRTLIKIKCIATSQPLWKIALGSQNSTYIYEPEINAVPDNTGSIGILNLIKKAGKQGKKTMKNKKTTEKISPINSRDLEKGELQIRENIPVNQAFTSGECVEMMGEMRQKGNNVYITDGRLYVSREVRATFGKYINWVLAIGKDEVNNLSEELGLDIKWLQRKQILSAMQSEDNEEIETQIPKLNEIKKMIKRGRPLLFNLVGEHIKSEFVGWELGEDYELGKPGTISIDLNPVVARTWFSGFNPLFSNVLAMKQQTKINIEITAPDNVPSPDHLDVKIDPLKFNIGFSPFLNQLTSLLKLEQILSVQGSSPFEVWTAQIQGSVLNDNTIFQCKRCDMLLGTKLKGIHIVLWGTYNSILDELDMWIGIPKETLARLGYTDLDKNYILPIPLKGTLEQPKFDWEHASNAIGKLALSQVQSMWPEEQGTLKGMIKSALATAAKNKLEADDDKGPDIPSSVNIKFPWNE